MKKIYVYQTDLDRIYGRSVSFTKSEYEKIKKSYEMLLSFIWFEEKYRVLLDNFYEFEKDVYKLFMECRNCDIDGRIQEIGEKGINILNRRLLNLTSSAKMYTDDIDKDVSNIFKRCQNTNIQEEIISFKRSKYDECASYQLLEFIRNVMQHRSMLIRGITIVNTLIDEDLPIVPVFVNIRLSDIKKNHNFQNKIKKKAELESYNCDDINIIFHIRKYIKVLDEIHNRYRLLTHSDVNDHLLVIENTLKNLESQGAMFNEIAFIELFDNLRYNDGILVNKEYIHKYRKKIDENKLCFEKYFLNRDSRAYKDLFGFNTKNYDIKLNMIF